MQEDQEPILPKDGTSEERVPSLMFKNWHWWFLVSLNITFLVVGQAGAILLGRIYYDQGGNSTWIATLVQTIAFPILLIPYYILPTSQDPSTESNPLSFSTVSLIYIFLGILLAGDNMLYSVGLLYLSASTYSLICATQLAFNAVFSFFLNSQKFTALILNSVVVLTFSASLIAVNDDSTEPSGISRWGYFLGFLFTLGASAVYALLLSLMQLTFEKGLRKETFSVVLEMQIFTSLIATFVSFAGLFASGEWKTLPEEMDAFGGGGFGYVMTLVWTSVAWQVSSVGGIGLIFLVSSLFSNVIGTFSLAVTPIAAVVLFRDKVNGAKIIAFFLALWGFCSYIYQNYLDDKNVKEIEKEDCEALSQLNCC